MTRWIIALLVACALPACFLSSPSYEDTSFECTEPMATCPSGYDCVNGMCVRPGSNPAGDAGDAVDANMPDNDPADARAAVDATPAADAALGPIVMVSLSGTGVITDTFLHENSPNANYGGNNEVSIDADPVQVTVMRFELAGIPAGAQIVSAELVLSVSDPIEQGDFVAYRLLEAWQENQATWNERSSGVPWASPGAGTGSYDPTPLLTFTPLTTGNYTVVLPAALVQSWVSQPATNFGLEWRSNSSEGRGGQFESSEAGAAGPIVNIQYR